MPKWAGSLMLNRKDTKKLVSDLAKLNIEIGRKKSNIKAAQQELAEDITAKNYIEKQIKLKKTPIQVSDHALLRYMERHMEFDIQTLKESLLTDSVKKSIADGANKIKIKGISFVVRNNIIVTTY